MVDKVEVLVGITWPQCPDTHVFSDVQLTAFPALGTRTTSSVIREFVTVPQPWELTQHWELTQGAVYWPPDECSLQEAWLQLPALSVPQC